MISNLPVEIENVIFYYCAEHPCAKMIEKQIHILTKDLGNQETSYIIDNGLFVRGTHYFETYTSSFKKTKIVNRWSGICDALADTLAYKYTNFGRRPITFGKLLDYLSCLRLNDIEKTWLRQRIKITNNSLVLI